MPERALVPIATLCAHATVVAALSLAARTGVLKALKAGPRPVDALRAISGLPPLTLAALLDALAWGQIVRKTGSLINTGPSFDEALDQAPYAQWFFEGSGALLGHVRGSAHPVRNSIAIAQAGAQYGALHVDPMVLALLDRLHFSAVTDLGCGSGERLLAVADRYDVPGLGLDLSPDVIALARQKAHARGKSQTLRFECASVILPGAVRRLPSDSDLMLCFFMGHDFWPRENCIQTLIDIREHFPRLKNFVFCDTHRVERCADDTPPPFVPAFRYVHGLLNQYIPTKDEWLEVFPSAGWVCREIIPVGIPDSDIFLLQPS